LGQLDRPARPGSRRLHGRDPAGLSDPFELGGGRAGAVQILDGQADLDLCRQEAGSLQVRVRGRLK